MAKYTLDAELEFNFNLYGIICHESEYVLCSFLNNDLAFNFEREKSLEIKIKKLQMGFHFSLFCSEDPETEKKVYLINNRSYGSYKDIKEEKVSVQSGLFDELNNDNETRYQLIPEKSDIDYFILLSGDFSPIWISMFKSKLTSSELILNCTEIDPNKLNSKLNLLF